MNQMIKHTERYFYIVHDIIPELMPGIAFRCNNRRKASKRKIVKCPYCGGRLTDVEASVKVELFRHPEKRKITCQGYIKCQSCKDEVGIVMA